MSEIKDVIEGLARGWSWACVQKHPDRAKLLSKRLEGVGIDIEVPTGPNFSRNFTFRHEKKNKDLRIWTKSQTGLLQWRTDPDKGDRLVYVAFGKKATTEKVPLEEIFMDPWHVDEGEVGMFEMLYPDLVLLIPSFAEAIRLADEKLEKIK